MQVTLKVQYVAWAERSKDHYFLKFPKENPATACHVVCTSHLFNQCHSKIRPCKRS